MSISVFLNLLAAHPGEKPEQLLKCVQSIRRGEGAPQVFQGDLSLFRAIEGTPFPYWASSKIFPLFESNPTVQSAGRDAQSGASTMDDFRFLRMRMEVGAESLATTRVETMADKRWVRIAKGGSHSRFYIDWDLVIDWRSGL